VRGGRSFGRRQQWREDAEQWREDPEAAGAAGRPGCAERAAREDDEVRGGRSFGRRQQWREDVGAAGKLGATSI
jgi:hypothetical protein